MTERKHRLSPATLAGDGLLLICALMGLTGSFLSLYGGEGLRDFVVLEPTALDLCAAQAHRFLLLAGLLALMSLAVWSLPRLCWLAVSAPLALWGLLVIRNWERLTHGALVTIRTISLIFSQRVSWGQVLEYSVTSTMPEEGPAVQLFLALVLLLLALILGWAVVRARRWWIVLLFTLPSLIPGLLADLYPDWLPFMALAACWCAMLLTDLCKWAAPSKRGALTLVMLPCVAVVLAVVTLAFPREGYTRPQWARSMEAEFYNTANRLADFFSQFDGPFQGRVTYVGSAEEADLTSAGPLNYTGRTVLRVKSDYEGRLYLRGSSLADYEDGVWKAMTDETFQAAVRGARPAPRVLFFPAMSTEHGPEYTVTVDNVGAVGSCVYAPYFPTVQELEENGMSMVNDALFARRQGRWTHTLSFVELSEPHPDAQDKEVSTIMLTTMGYEGSVDFVWYSDFVCDHYLDVREGYQEHLARFCMENGVSDAARYGSSYDAVQAAREVADLLDRLCTYDPETPAAPEGTDPVEYFLNDSRQGYCMHFASAATLMLRSLGIPARYVSGFTVESVPGREVTVPDRAAHAWVEVWVSGFGWYPVEVTPAAAFSWYDESILPEDLPSVPLPESEAPEPTPTPSQNITPSEQPSAPQSGDDGPADGIDWTGVLAVVKALAAVLGAAFLVWLAQYLPKQYRARRLSNPDRNRAALDGYGYLKRMERWGGRMDERAVELAQKARFSQHTLTREEQTEMRALVDHERERLCVILDPVPRLVFRYLWGMPIRPKIGENGENDRENGA